MAGWAMDGWMLDCLNTCWQVVFIEIYTTFEQNEQLVEPQWLKQLQKQIDETTFENKNGTNMTQHIFIVAQLGRSRNLCSPSLANIE